jgi:hypothetical protein
MTTLALELLNSAEADAFLWMEADDSSFYNASGIVELEPSEALKREFRHLADWWHSETDAASTDREKTTHEAYRRVVQELGEPAVPFILRDMQLRRGHWFQALRKLTGRNDIGADAAGSISRARDAWIAWGESEGLI